MELRKFNVIIYKITNLITKNFYIGQTILTTEERFNIHVASVNKNLHLPLYRAIKKHGKENFEVKTLYKTNSQEDLDAKEEQLIAYFKITNKSKLYNIADGGKSKGFNRYLNAKKTIDVKSGQIFDSAKEMAIFYGLSYIFTIELLNGNALSKKGYIFRYLDEKSRKESDEKAKKLPKHRATPRPILCVETNKTYSSIKEAAGVLNISRTAINNNLTGRSRTAGKLIFKYLNDKSL